MLKYFLLYKKFLPEIRRISYSMLFNSIDFLIFLPIVFILYWALPHKYRWALILVSSYYFYMSWNAKYMILILFTTFMSYGAALLIEKFEDKKVRKFIIAATLIICLGVLFFFKYFNFVSNSVTEFLNLFALQLHPVTLNFILPVGISFYTFQTLSYVIDVYRGVTKAERHFGVYAAFISFFPQLVAGPIERSSNLLPQIKTEHHFDYDKAVYGTKIMLWGYFKKIVIADMLAAYVDLAYVNQKTNTGFMWIIATFFFTLQIYCDFSGYSDIAIGTAKLLDIDLMTNFKSPYFASSIQEFWRRWHISLSTWFKDYVYIPLGGNRCSKIRRSFNLLITFLVSGLWHGANWTYVIWGAVHGIAQIIESVFAKSLKTFRAHKTGKFLSTIFVFLFCSFAWIFFRAETLTDAVHIISHMFTGIGNFSAYIESGLIALGLNDTAVLVYILGLIFILMLYDYLNKDTDLILTVTQKHPAFQWCFYTVLGLFVVFFAQKGVAAEFVYFQF